MWILRPHECCDKYWPVCAELFRGHDSARGSDQEVLKNLAGRVGPDVRRVLEMFRRVGLDRYQDV